MPFLIELFQENGFLIIQNFWFLAGGPKLPQTPPLNGRAQHLIEAAKRGRLDQINVFGAADDSGAADVDRPKTAENGSDRRETLGKRVSDDSQHFIIRRRKNVFGQIFDENYRHKNFSSENRQTACFCGAMDFWT